MAKYIDADKLLAEIEIIRHSLEHRDVRFDQIKQIQTDTMSEFCKMMKETIDSLQQEQPEVDLEKEIEFAIPQPYSFLELGTFNAESVYSREQMVAFARHFYELGLNARKEEQL